VLCLILIIAAGKRDKTCGVIAKLVPAIIIRITRVFDYRDGRDNQDKPGRDQAGTARSFAPVTAAGRNARPYRPCFRRVLAILVVAVN
jgi:hypothetical protein